MASVPVAAVDRVGLVGRLAGVDGLAVGAVALVVVKRAYRLVDGDFVKIGAMQAQHLGIEIGEQPPLEQRIVAEVDARTICPGLKATCSVSAKKLSGLRLSTIRPMGSTGTCSSGMSLVGSSRSKSNLCSSFSSTICTHNSHSRASPFSISFHISRRLKSGSRPQSFWASSQISEQVPATGFQ